MEEFIARLNDRNQHLVAGSGKKVWWRCSKGHEWQLEIYRRKAGQICPIYRRALSQV